jgi:hypothetical protein
MEKLKEKMKMRENKREKIYQRKITHENHTQGWIGKYKGGECWDWGKFRSRRCLAF